MRQILFSLMIVMSVRNVWDAGVKTCRPGRNVEMIMKIALAVLLLVSPLLFGCLAVKGVSRAEIKQAEVASGEPSELALLPLKVGDDWGYIDKTGKMVINPQFDFAYPFSEGLALVGMGKGGYIDKTGKIVINPQFDGASGFSEGLALVTTQRRYMGYIDKTGKFVINPQFYDAWPFSEGLAAVQFDVNWGYIDKTGKIVIKAQFTRAWPFSEGLASVAFGNKWGYIDKTGTIVINPQFDGARGFSEGLAPVEIEEEPIISSDGLTMGPFGVFKYGYIDKTGMIVINPQFDWAADFSEGLARVRVGDEKTGKCGYIDKTGTIVIDPQFYWAGDLSEGLARVWIGDKGTDKRGYNYKETGKWGYIDKTGKIVINPQFDWADDFSEGLAHVQIGDCGGGYEVDRTGDVVHGGPGGESGYIDKTGKYVWEPSS